MIFETRNSDLAAFLIISGEQFLGMENVGRVVYLSFKDPLEKCRDLERVFLNSECKKFSDTKKWLISKIKDHLGGL